MRAIGVVVLACLTFAACTSSNDLPPLTNPPPTPSTSATSPTNEATPPATETTPGVVVPEGSDPVGAATTDDLDAIAGRLVFRNDNGDLVVASPDGSDEVVLSHREQQLGSQPTWSSSGTQVAWSSLSTDGPLLVIADADGTNIRSSAVPTPAFYLSWSPDDVWLAGLRNGPAGIELIIVDPIDASARAVGPGQPFFTDWTTNQSLVAAIGGTALVDIPTSADEPTVQRPLTSPLGVFQSPIVLPDGDVIVALRDGDLNVVTRLSGIVEARLGTAKGPVVMALNHAGTELAVFVAREETLSEVISFQTADLPALPAGQVSIIDLETGVVSTREETQIGAINWSPDDTTLALLQFGDSKARWLYARDDEVIRGVVFVPSRELASVYLPFSDQYQRSSTWWAPDSSAFVTSGAIDGEAGVWVDIIDDGKGPARIGGGDIAFWSPN